MIKKYCCKNIFYSVNIFTNHSTNQLSRFLFLLFFFPFQNTYSQSYPITASLQIIPPYNVYLPDYCVPGSDKIRVILLQNDLTVPVYDVRLQMTIEWNGTVIMRTSPNFRPRPITLHAGVPNLISGDDLCIYLNTDAINFSGYSRENYERTKALPEGAYKISFTAYDYRRQNVQVSNVGSNIFFLQKKSPPLLNSPICNSRVQKTDPQFIVFNWSSVNTPSLPGNETEYTFSLFEIKPKNSNPNYIVKSSRPIFTTVTESNIFQYTPGEPALLDSMEYVWIVQARSKDGRDLYANQGYSIPCKFTYGGVDPFAVKYIRKPSVFANPIHEKAAKVWWAPARETENVELYRIEYRGSTNSLGEFPWHTEERATDTTLTVYPLEPDREYDVRMRYKVSGVYGPYSEIIKFKTPPHKVVECGQPPNPLPLSTNTTPLPSALVGTIVRIGLFDVILTQVSGENGTFSGKGKIVTLGFGFGMALQFKDIFINTDKVVTRGDMYSEGDSMDKYVDEKIDRQHKVEAFKKFADKIPDENTPLLELQEFAKALTEIPQDRIDNAVALNREEKQQINDARSKANDALKILNNPQATDKEKKEAEKNLRQAVADAKPALNKLANTLDKGIITVVSQWFKKVMDFLNAYKGNESDKKQAIVWHSKMDSTVNALSKHTDVPANLMKAMLDAHQNAKPAWTSLEKGTDGIRPKGPSADFEEGHTPEDIALCKTNVETAEAVEKYVSTPAEKGIVNSEAGNYVTPDKRLVHLPAGAEIFYNCENESKFQNTGYLYKFRADNKIWQAAGTEHLGSGFQFEQYTSGSEQYTIGTLAREGGEVWQVTQNIVQNQRTLSIQKRKLSNTTAYSTIFEKSEKLSDEQSISVTTKCDKKPTPNAAIDTTTISDPKGRYVAKVYLQEGKWQAKVTLKGQPKVDSLRDKLIAKQEAIEAEMSREIAEKLNELGGLHGKRSKKVTQSTEDGGEFWVKDMDGLEWLQTIGNLGSSVWEDAAVPQEYWNKDKGYEESTVHLPPTFAGVSDGAVEKITEFPQLVKVVYDVATKEEVRKGLWNSVKSISPESIKNVFVKFYEEKKANYTSDKRYIVLHTGGKDAVAIAFVAWGALSLLNDAIETTGQTIKKAIQKKLDEIKKYFDTKEFAKRIDDRFSNYKGKLSKEEYIKRYKTLYTNKEIGKLTEEQFKLLEGGVKPSKGIATSDGKRYFDNVLDGTAREVKSGPVTLSRHKEQILKDIEILNNDLTRGQVTKIEWRCFAEVDKSVIENFIKDNLVTELKNKNIFQIIKY